MSAVAVGLDVGTSGLKAVAMRVDDGALVATATREYPLALPRPTWVEQAPADYARAADDALAEVAATVAALGHEVAAIGVTGQMHTAVLLDASLAVVRPAILWCDGRTGEECRAIERRLGDDGLRRLVKNRPREGFTLPKLLWLRAHEPEAFARVRHVLMPKDWIVLHLTGELSADVSDASGTLAFDPAARAWSDEMLGAFDLPSGLFPAAGESVEVAGALSREAASRAGLRARLPVVRGAADNAAAAVGLGVVREGRAMVSIGTSGVVLAHSEALRVVDAMTLHAFSAAVPGASYSMGVMLAAGLALRWFRDVVAKLSYDEITAMAAKVPVGAGGLVFLPYLNGERTPHDDALARGAFVGLTAATGQAELARAVLEGIAFGLRDCHAPMREAAGARARWELRITGGGARSELLRSIVADALDASVVVTNSTEGPALGAALLAAAGAGLVGDLTEAADALVREVSRTEPDAARAARYAELHAQYAGTYRELRERFHALSR